MVTAKRPKVVIGHILKFGLVTTEDLKTKYGYNHPPRAARDVREQGIPLVTTRVTDSTGRKIGAYTFGDPSQMRFGRIGGRTAFARRIKEELIKRDGARCAIYLEELPERELQIDHRIPYEVLGDAGRKDLAAKNYMLLCGSANRAKSWSCEQCANWRQKKDPAICRTCYWAYPDEYTHIAMRPARRLDIMWQGTEVEVYDRLKTKADGSRQEMRAYVKKILKENV
jgi:hypothetical protein